MYTGLISLELSMTMPKVFLNHINYKTHKLLNCTEVNMPQWFTVGMHSA